MTRKLMWLCAALVALAGESAYGVGLGELELHSALNQRLDAEIKLTNVGRLESDELLANLASQEDFKRVGVERHFSLMDLRFNVETKERGEPVIKVTSTGAIVEPYLNFIVELLWPSGRILREYTVLLDPPVFGEDGVERIRMGETERPSRAQVEEPPQRERPRPEPQPRARGERIAEEGQLTDDEYGLTGPGDTLWAIALKVRPNDSVSVQQTMLALQRTNPDAFINGNINLLKAGHVLRVPDLNEIRSQGRQEAIRQVQRHNRQFDAWQQGARELAQLDASGRQRDGGSQASQESGELRLLANERDTGGRSGTGGAPQRQAELEADLAVAKEDLDRAHRANQELESRITDLEGQIEDLNALIEAKDKQLATLQNELKRQLAQADTQTPAEPATQASQTTALLTNPFVLGGLGLVLIGGLAGGMVYMRKRQQSTAMEAGEFQEMGLEEEPTQAGATEEDDAGELEAEEIDEELAPQTSDVISEAEIYIAYGRFPQAITFLQNAIEAEPERSDLHLKLLEVYVQTEDATAFNLQYEKLKALGDEEAIATAAELQQKIPGAAEAAGAAAGGAAMASEPAAAADESADDSDDELSFDLDDLDSETEEEEFDLGSDLEDEDEAELDLDLDLDLEEDTAAQALEAETPAEAESEEDTAEAEAPTEEDEFDLDLGDDLDLDLDSDEDTTEEGVSSDTEDESEFSLDAAEFSFEEEEETTSTGDDTEFELSDDDTELDLDDTEFSLDDEDTEIDLGEEETTSTGDDTEFELSDDDTELDLDDAEFSLDDDDSEFNLDEEDTTESTAEDTEFELSDDDTGLDLDDDDELDLGDAEDTDENGEDAGTKLDLARAYIDMGDKDGARNVLQQVLKEGSDTEIQRANELLESIG